MIIKISFAMVALFLINCSCSKEDMGKYPFEIKDLSYRGKLIFNNEFRRDGYYYSAEDVENKESSVEVLIFFNDGYLCALGVDYSLIETQKTPNIDYVREIPYHWGCYILEEKVIKSQIYNSNRGISKFRTHIEYFEIINDTTIRMYKRIYDNGRVFNKTIEFNRLYYFQKTDDKPDSTNILMEY